MTDAKTSTPRFKGAWLTDIDDTVLRSGHRPDDEWIEYLAEFIRQLKSRDIVWAPVSGVALAKMGPRFLFRLPLDVLTHVICYGGEGGVKSYYDFDTEKWVSPADYQRNFSDAQSLVIVGKQRFEKALQTLLQQEENAADIIKQRITAAENVLQGSRYETMPSIVDQMETELELAGYEPAKAETYFRGGAISWMMFGDISVKHYKGKHETQTRTAINAFAKNKLDELDYLQDIGEHGVHMPYLHATRGIKLILMGNDKGRAADDLIQKEKIAPDSLLFVGNELFEGGNDDPVRRVEGITIMSVGEKEDPGVIDGGIQVDVNKRWMNQLVGKLNIGQAWPDILKELPTTAEVHRLHVAVEREKSRAHKMSPWHEDLSERLPTNMLVDLYLKYGESFKEARRRLTRVKAIQTGLVKRLAVLEKYHYDNARKLVDSTIGGRPSVGAKTTIKRQIKDFLLPEIHSLLKQVFIDQLNLKEKRICKEFSKVNNLSSLKNAVEQLIESSSAKNKAEELHRAFGLIASWENRIEEMVEQYFKFLEKWQKDRVWTRELIITDESVLSLGDDIDPGDVYRYFRWLMPRIVEFPHMKELEKPTIILVAGTSGVGKSTISRHISKTMGIPTSFSSDVASRSVIREAISFLLGSDGANKLFPEVFGSSFDEDNLDWFYGHSLMTMVGVIGNISRLIKENISAVIDGVALIPGSLPEKYFDKANIVWIVASVADVDAHYDRLGTRSETGVERGGADRYRDQFSAIRSNHDRLVEMGKKSRALVLDNSQEIASVLDKVLERVNDPYADRGLEVDDPVRDAVQHDLQERSTWEIQNVVMRDDTQEMSIVKANS